MPVCYVANTAFSVAHEAFDEETVLINLERGTYFSLRGSAPTLWLLLQQPVSVEGLVGVLAREVPLPADAGAAIGAMLEQLAAEGCVLKLDTAEQLPTDLTSLALLGGSFSVPDVQTFHDLQELIVIDPVHEVADFDGWPHRPPPFALD